MQAVVKKVVYSFRYRPGLGKVEKEVFIVDPPWRAPTRIADLDALKKDRARAPVYSAS